MADKKKGKPSDKKWAVMGGIALNVEYMRKYGFEASAAAKVTAKLVAVPAPAAFQAALQADAVGRKQRKQTGSNGGDTGAKQGGGSRRGDGERLGGESGKPGSDKPHTDGSTGASEPLYRRALPSVDDEEGDSLFLHVPEAVGVAYVLDDGVVEPAEGTVGMDGILVHPISAEAQAVTIRFANGLPPVTLRLDRTDESIVNGLGDDAEFWDDELYDDIRPAASWLRNELDEDDEEDGNDGSDDDGEDGDDDELPMLDLTLAAGDELWDMGEEEAAEEIAELAEEDDMPALALLVPQKADVDYRFTDSTGAIISGTAEPDGQILIPIADGVQGGSLQFADGTEAIEFSFATD
jgi:hypothetical protein